MATRIFIKKGGLTTCEKHGKYMRGCDSCRIVRNDWGVKNRRKHGVLVAGSEEHRLRLSDAQKNRITRDGHHFLGKNHTDETKLKISETKRTGSEIICRNCSGSRYERLSRQNAKFCSNRCRGISKRIDPRLHSSKRKLHSYLRGLIEWRNWREYIFKRDSYRCIDCGGGGYLEPHHIIPIRVDPNKAFDVNNGITLCQPCHKKTYGKELELAKTYFSLIQVQL